MKFNISIFSTDIKTLNINFKVLNFKKFVKLLDKEIIVCYNN